MRSWRDRRWTLYFLLAVFAGGGLLAPWAHRIEHAFAPRHEHAEAAQRIAADRAAGEPAAGYLVNEETALDDVPCLLCQRHVTCLDVVLDVAAAMPARGALVAPPAHLVPTSARTALPIRAPPGLAA